MAALKARYRAYSDYLRERFGTKVYKLPLKLPVTCPNRDGTLGVGGCIYCDEEGAGFECLPSSVTVEEQLARNKEFFRRRYKAGKFIAYFQAFSNTYLPFELFQKYIRSAAETEDLVGISVSTRPDCVSDPYLDFLAEVGREKNLLIDVELGLQTVNYRTLLRINRGHTLGEFIDAVGRVKKRGLEVCAHLILNLPWDDMVDVIESAKVLSALEVDYVKLHSLYVVRGTVLGEMYQKGEINIIPMEEYVARAVTFLEYLRPDTVIQRLVGRGPHDKLLFANWGVSWWQVVQRIEARLEELDTYQGRLCDYLNGPALRKRFGEAQGGDPGE
ncbi:TIGR01212 family radical SAM protein [Desulfovirgula thermocuniculi]|uniref:TIGR01212 family radical SAM protein n=1 Tax=Desulfovirgula thermocuniculi TaxID=348842 RepID=UPI0004110B1F|nr:TIGR01212 family radical SAM protein [Desulfovirgula thermocuniculi]